MLSGEILNMRRFNDDTIPFRKRKCSRQIHIEIDDRVHLIIFLEIITTSWTVDRNNGSSYMKLFWNVLKISYMFEYCEKGKWFSTVFSFILPYPLLNNAMHEIVSSWKVARALILPINMWGGAVERHSRLFFKYWKLSIFWKNFFIFFKFMNLLSICNRLPLQYVLVEF